VDHVVHFVTVVHVLAGYSHEEGEGVSIHGALLVLLFFGDVVASFHHLLCFATVVCLFVPASGADGAVLDLVADGGGHALTGFFHEVDRSVGVGGHGVFETSGGLETGTTSDFHNDAAGAGRTRTGELGHGGRGLGGELGGDVLGGVDNDGLLVEFDVSFSFVGTKLAEDRVGFLVAVHVRANYDFGALPGAVGGGVLLPVGVLDATVRVDLLDEHFLGGNLEVSSKSNGEASALSTVEVVHSGALDEESTADVGSLESLEGRGGFGGRGGSSLGCRSGVGGRLCLGGPLVGSFGDRLGLPELSSQSPNEDLYELDLLVELAAIKLLLETSRFAADGVNSLVTLTSLGTTELHSEAHRDGVLLGDLAVFSRCEDHLGVIKLGGVDVGLDVLGFVDGVGKDVLALESEKSGHSGTESVFFSKSEGLESVRLEPYTTVDLEQVGVHAFVVVGDESVLAFAVGELLGISHTSTSNGALGAFVGVVLLEATNTGVGVRLVSGGALAGAHVLVREANLLGVTRAVGRGKSQEAQGDEEFHSTES